MSGGLDGLLARRGLRDLPLARRRMRARVAGLGVPSRILDAMDAVPRHAFVPAAYWRLAYAESGLWLPSGASLPAPEATARILTALDPGDGDRLLEIGTGTGYLAALLGCLGGSVLTLDDADLTDGALAAARLTGVRQVADGGPAEWQPEAPFDGILLSRPVPVPPVEMVVRCRRLVAVVGSSPGPCRLLLARAGDAEARVTDLGPLIVPTPAMARAVSGGASPASWPEGDSGLEGGVALEGGAGGAATWEGPGT